MTEATSDHDLHSSKRAAADGGEQQLDLKKKQKLQISPDRPQGVAAPADTEAVASSPNGAPVFSDRGKAVLTAADKGKGKMVVEDDGGVSDDESDGEEVEGEEEDGAEDSDYEDDPLAEVDLSNILPSRTRRRGAPIPGEYLVNEQDVEDDDDEDEDEDEVLEEDEEESD